MERKIEASKIGMVEQELTGGGTDRAAQNVVRASEGNYDAPIIIFLSGER